MFLKLQLNKFSLQWFALSFPCHSCNRSSRSRSLVKVHRICGNKNFHSKLSSSNLQQNLLNLDVHLVLPGEVLPDLHGAVAVVVRERHQGLAEGRHGALDVDLERNQSVMSGYTTQSE